MNERERLRRAEELFLTARRLSGEQRREFLRRECGGDTELEREVTTLLGSLRGGRSFLETPAVELELGAQAEAALRMVGKRIGNYSIVRALGEGGFGRVYLAEQEQPVRRRVALKLLKPGLRSQRLIARFESELQTLARMDHPGIARVFDAGAMPDGRPFYAMDYVPGVPLADYCDERGLELRARIELFVKVAEAVQHAHGRGVIHRDLKPSNVLVLERDGVAQPVVIDFGVAKTLDAPVLRSLITEDGLVIGTLDYMSPEQARGRRDEIDIRSDVYSLGVMLYELCVGVRPHDLALKSPLDAARTIAEAPVVKPSTRRRSLRGDLETILLKALEKEPAARYATAAALVEDLQRYLAGRAILAHAPNPLYLFARFARRNRLLVASSAAACVALVVGALGLARGAVVAARASEVARKEQAKAETLGSFLLDMLQQVDPAVAQGRAVTVVEVLNAAQARLERFDGPPEVEATLRAAFGEALRRMRHFERAAPQLERAVELRRRELGLEHVATLHAQYQLAQLRADQDRLAEAEELLRSTHAAQERVLGGAHADTIASGAMLGAVLNRLGRSREAEPLLRDALDARRASADSELDVAWISARLGQVLLALGHDGEGERLLREALAGRDSAHLQHHPDTADAQCQLAAVLERDGRFDEAIEYRRAAFATYSRVFGADDPRALDCARDLTEVYRVTGRMRDAEREARQRLLLCAMKFGAQAPQTHEAAHLMAETLTSRERSDEARRILSEDLARREQVLGPDDGATLAAASSLAELLLRQGDLDAAEGVARDAFERLQGVFGVADVRTLTVQATLARVQLERCAPLAAEQLLRAVPERLAERLGRQHPLVLAAESSLASALIALERLDEALARIEAALGAVDVNAQLSAPLAALLRDGGELWLRRGDATRARERLIQAREKFVALTGASSSDVRAVDALLARARG